jgi:hypothetical protein
VKTITKICASIALVVFSQLANAAPITYTINRLIPTLIFQNGYATATGFITTNGKLGAIGYDDIISYGVQTTITTNNVASVSVLLTRGNSSFASASNPVIASADTLFLDGSLGPSAFGFQNAIIGNPQDFWLVSLIANLPSESVSSGGLTEYASLNSVLSVNSRVELATTSGRLTQGVIRSPNSVPLPSSALLIAMGLGLFHRLGRKTR